MRYCKRCVTPDTRPHIVFNEEGICDACITGERKDDGINWDARWKELEEILDKYRSDDPSKHDCIIPVSGGKDSTYQVYTLKNDFNMNPLAVTFAQCSITELGQHNMQALREIGVDHILYTPNPKIYRKLFREGFVRVGDSCWACHAGIFTTPIQIAVKFNIPLIVYGENSQMEYGGPDGWRDVSTTDRRWLEEYGLSGNRIDSMVDGEIPWCDLKPYMYPSDEEIKRVGITAIELGYYIRWDARKHLKVALENTGFKVSEKPYEGSWLNYENLDCGFVGFHDYLMYLKYGFGRATTQTSIDIRNGRLTREEAIEIVNQHDGRFPQTSFKEFLDFMDMDEEEFWEACDSFVNKGIFEKDENGMWVKKASARLR